MSLIGKLAFLRSQAFGGKRIIKEDERHDEGESDSEYALDDEQPSPALDATKTVHSRSDRSGEDAAEGAGQDSSRVKDDKSFGLLVLAIPTRDDEHDSRLPVLSA